MELLVLLAMTVGVVGLAGRLPESRRVKRLLGARRPDSYMSLAEGRAITLHGRVVAAGEVAPLVSPLTSRACVYWRAVFEEMGAGDDAREIGRAEDSCTFMLVGGDGTVRVVPGSPQIALPGVHQLRPGTQLEDHRYTDSVLALARKVCVRLNYPHSSVVRVTEYVVTPGSEITIRGYGTQEPHPDAADHASAQYRGDAPMRYVVSGSRRTRLLIG